MVDHVKKNWAFFVFLKKAALRSLAAPDSDCSQRLWLISASYLPVTQHWSPADSWSSGTSLLQ